MGHSPSLGGGVVGSAAAVVVVVDVSVRRRTRRLRTTTVTSGELRGLRGRIRDDCRCERSSSFFIVGECWRESGDFDEIPSPSSDYSSGLLMSE